jgi:outer membrane lipopolysaccharide assembly protein LptE/RlpB
MRLVSWVAVALVLATGPGCDFNFKVGYFEEDKKAALVALDIFHQRLSDAHFEAIYENGSDVLRAQPKEQLLAAMKETHEKWGKLTSSKVVASSCFPNEVRLLVEAQFEKGLAGEFIVWRVQNREAHLQHFQIFPGPVATPSGANECGSRS